MGLRKLVEKSAFVDILKGMSVTGQYFTTERNTVEYPREKIPPHYRFRGMQALVTNPETGELNCDACHLCATICPSECITVESSEGPDGRKRLDSFEINLGRCVFCGFCEEVCPRAAIVMTKVYELATYDKGDFILTKDKLLANQKNAHKELRER